MKKELKTWEKTIKLTNGYWEYEDHIREALQWLFEVKLKILTTNTIVSVKDFKDNRLYGLLLNIFNGSPYKAINYMYPNKFKIWEKCNVPDNYWEDDNNIKEALKWLFEEKLDIFHNNIILTSNTFKDNRLGGLLYCVFFNSPYDALNYIYPGKFKIWEKCNIPKRYWKNEDHVKEALQWLFEEKLNIFEDDTTITTKDFKKYHLSGLLVNRFKGSIYKAIDYMYPGKFKIWEKCNVPKDYWSDDNHIKEALHWLVDEKGYKITNESFYINKIYAIIHHHTIGELKELYNK